MLFELWNFIAEILCRWKHPHSFQFLPTRLCCRMLYSFRDKFRFPSIWTCERLENKNDQITDEKRKHQLTRRKDEKKLSIPATITRSFINSDKLTIFVSVVHTVAHIDENQLRIRIVWPDDEQYTSATTQNFLEMRKLRAFFSISHTNRSRLPMQLTLWTIKSV